MTTATLKAKDVHEACRLLHNAIIKDRMKIKQQALTDWIAWKSRLPWRLFPHVSEQQYMEKLNANPRYKLFWEQLLFVDSMMYLAEGALRVDPNATMQVDHSAMKHFELGWQEMTKNERDTENIPKPGAGGLLREGLKGVAP